MQGQYSLRSPAVKRLMKEAQELREPTEQYHAQPLEDNLFEWHFTIRGPADSEFNGGIYHGRIILPPEYPMKPPSIIVLTPNGRFETHTKICLSISGHHPESWQPSWSIRTALLAIIGFMPTHGAGAMGSLDYTPEERKRLAKKSLEYKCPVCGGVKDLLHPVTDASKSDREEAKELASQINFQGEKQKASDNSEQKPQEAKENATSSSSSSSAPSTQAPSYPGMMMPPWAQMPGANFSYNPAVPQAPSGIRPPATNAVPQMAPFMPLAQFMAMQAMMQQQMRGMVPPPMMAPGWGIPSSVPGVMPGFPTPQVPTVPTSSSPSTNSNSSTSVTSTGSSTSTPTSTSVGCSVSNISTTNATTSASANITSSPSRASVAEPSGASATGQGVRQRMTASSSEPAPSQERSAGSNARSQGLARSGSSQAPSGLTQVIMAVLAVGILLLLIRRLAVMGILRFDQNAEL